MDIFNKKLENGDILGALDVAILEAENAKKLAQDALKEMDERQKRMDAIADAALAKYKKPL